MTVRLFFALCSLYLAFSSQPLLAQQARKRDIIILMVDTLRADHLGAYGYKKADTQVIDQLAAEGAIFMNAYTPMPRTTPGVASFFTGLWPHNHGANEVGRAIRNVPTLAEILKRAGYGTVGVSANLNASKNQRFDKGFDSFFCKRVSADTISNEALDRVKTIPAEQPLFLWTLYIDPHSPYRSYSKYNSKGAGDDCNRHFISRGKERFLTRFNFQSRGEKSVESCRELYDGEIARTDDAIGMLLEQYRKLRPGRDPLIVFTSDHGEHFGERDFYYEHGPHVHDAALKVPLIIHGSEIKHKTDKALISLEDLAPTLLTVTGVKRSLWPKFDGIDLSHRLGVGKATRPTKEFVFGTSSSSLQVRDPHTVYSGRAGKHFCFNGEIYSLCRERGQDYKLYNHKTDHMLTVDISSKNPDKKKQMIQWASAWQPEQVREQTIVSKRFKLVKFPLLQGGYKVELYDLQSGQEGKDVSKSFPDVKEQLLRRLDNWLPSDKKIEAEEVRSEEELEGLRSLGYL